MARWFDKKLEKNNLRKYTRRRIGRRKSGDFLRGLSITNWLILVNVLVFIFIWIFLQFGYVDSVLSLALRASDFFSGSYWQIFTSMFIHLSFEHLLVNMVSLFFIGNFVERLIGRKRIFWLYIISGVFAGFFYAVLAYFFGAPVNSVGELVMFSENMVRFGLFGSPLIIAVGASGAIFSLLGLLALLTPRNRVYLIAGPIIAVVVYYTLAFIFPDASLLSILGFLVMVYFFISVFLIFSFDKRRMMIALPIEMPFWVLPFIAIIPLVVIGLLVPLPIGNTAHLGGLLVGLGYAYYLRRRYKRKTAMIQKYFSR
jgi:rhomboid protease GluP